MPDETKPDAHPVRRTRVAEAADAITDGAEKLGRMSPQQTINLICIIALTAIVAVFAWKTWQEGEERKAERRANEETHASQLRENNAQMELTRTHCGAETDKARREAREESERVRREAREDMKQVMATFLSEGERQREFQARENEKLRAVLKVRGE